MWLELLNYFIVKVKYREFLVLLMNWHDFDNQSSQKWIKNNLLTFSIAYWFYSVVYIYFLTTDFFKFKLRTTYQKEVNLLTNTARCMRLTVPLSPLKHLSVRYVRYWLSYENINFSYYTICFCSSVSNHSNIQLPSKNICSVIYQKNMSVAYAIQHLKRNLKSKSIKKMSIRYVVVIIRSPINNNYKYSRNCRASYAQLHFQQTRKKNF